MNKAMIILYVADQARSRDFYRSILDTAPLLDVPGMTEFPLAGGVSLGLMPEGGTTSFLGTALPAASGGNGIPRCELYLHVDDPAAHFLTLQQAGGTALGAAAPRPWGDTVAYGADPDGHIVAFAKTTES